MQLKADALASDACSTAWRTARTVPSAFQKCLPHNGNNSIAALFEERSDEYPTLSDVGVGQCIQQMIIIQTQDVHKPAQPGPFHTPKRDGDCASPIQAARIQRSVCSVSEMTKALTFRDVPEEAGATPCDVGAVSARRQFQGYMERTAKVPIPKQCCAYLRKGLPSGAIVAEQPQQANRNLACAKAVRQAWAADGCSACACCLPSSGGASSDGVHCSRRGRRNNIFSASSLNLSFQNMTLRVLQLAFSGCSSGEGAVACRISIAGRQQMSPHVHAIPVVTVAEPGVVIRRVQRGAVGCRQRLWYDTRARIQDADGHGHRCHKWWLAL